MGLHLFVHSDAGGDRCRWESIQYGDGGLNGERTGHRCTCDTDLAEPGDPRSEEFDDGEYQCRGAGGAVCLQRSQHWQHDPERDHGDGSQLLVQRRRIRVETRNRQQTADDRDLDLHLQPHSDAGGDRCRWGPIQYSDSRLGGICPGHRYKEYSDLAESGDPCSEEFDDDLDLECGAGGAVCLQRSQHWQHDPERDHGDGSQLLGCTDLSKWRYQFRQQTADDRDLDLYLQPHSDAGGTEHEWWWGWGSGQHGGGGLDRERTGHGFAHDPDQSDSGAKPIKNVNEIPGFTYSFVGEVVHYTFLVSNSGNVSLTGPITVADDKTTDENCPDVNSVGNLDLIFDVGESMTCTATHTITLADLQSSSITNHAIAHANYGGAVIDSNTSQRTVNKLVNTGDPSNLLKSLIATNHGFTINPNVAIGEILTFEIQVYIPVGVFNNVIVTDNMGLGLAFVRCTGIASGGLITSEYGNDFNQICTHPSVDAIPSGDPTPENWGRQVVFNFGSISNTSEDQRLTITYEAVVLDNSANLNGTLLTNSVEFTSSSGPLTPDDPSPTLTVVEPRLSILKTVDQNFVNIGSVITYTLTINHTGASLTPAFDTLVHDTLPADLLLLSVNCGLSSVAPTSCMGNAGTGDVDVVWNTFPLAATGVIEIQARVLSFPVIGQIVNTANVEWTSLPGPVPGPLSPYNTLSSERWYDPGGSVVNDYGATASLPIFLATQLKTGFAPGRFTFIGPIPSANYYTPGNLELDIPSLKLEEVIVGVPTSSTGWDLTWLWNKVGWLEGTAYPTWLGNSVLTGHAYMPNGKPGPFMNIGQLIWGDQIIVHAYGTQYIYSVRYVALLPYDDQSYLSHSDQSTLTLVTCKSYDEEKAAYRWHVVVRAVLTSKVDDK